MDLVAHVLRPLADSRQAMDKAQWAPPRSGQVRSDLGCPKRTLVPPFVAEATYGMKKVRVRLSGELKDRLKQAAAASGKSEAELICEGVSHVVKVKLAPKPRIPLFSSGDPTLAERVDEILDEGCGKD